MLASRSGVDNMRRYEIKRRESTTMIPVHSHFWKTALVNEGRARRSSHATLSTCGRVMLQQFPHWWCIQEKDRSLIQYEFLHLKAYFTHGVPPLFLQSSTRWQQMEHISNILKHCLTTCVPQTPVQNTNNLPFLPNFSLQNAIKIFMCSALRCTPFLTFKDLFCTEQAFMM